MLNTRPLEIHDFSGGLTDYPLGASMVQMGKAENLIISETKKPEQRVGSTIYDDTYYLVPSGNKRIGTLIEHGETLLFQSDVDMFYIDGAWQTLQGPSGNSVFNAGDETNYVSYGKWNNQLFVTNDAFASPMKIYKDNSGDWQVRNAGLPALASNPTITPDADDSKNYLYYFVHTYDYYVGTILFSDYGATTQVEVNNAADFSGVGHYNQISVIPELANGATNNYDTTNIKIKIYRTEHNGLIPYYVGEVTNGTTTFEDTVTDATLVNNVLLYTVGGAYDNDTPPAAKYLTVANDICWYANVKEGSAYKPNRVRQSIQADPDSCPESFYIDVESDITGISSVNSIPIVFCKNKTYRLEGFVDFLGRGIITKRSISDTVGCISNNSIVSTESGIFFAAESGFYFTDGQQVIKLSNNINESYAGFVDTDAKKKRIYGTYDFQKQRVWWAVHEDSANTDNDKCYILDLRWSQPGLGVFTTACNNDNFSPTSLLFYNGQIIRGDRRAYVFKHDESVYTDPAIDVSKNPDEWGTSAIIYDYRSILYDFGTTAVRKWLSNITVNLDNYTNISLQVSADTDSSNAFIDLAEIRYRDNVIWGDPEVVWGTDTIRWNYEDMIKEKRRFPAGTLRCSHKQIRMTNSLTIIDKSDIKGTATVDNTALTATLDTALMEWEPDCVDYYISFADDDYVKEYLIGERTSDTVITFFDPLGTAPTGVQEWQMRGYKKGERFSLVGYTLWFAMLSDSFNTYKSDGGNE